jgi:hypothetical protein
MAEGDIQAKAWRTLPFCFLQTSIAEWNKCLDKWKLKFIMESVSEARMSDQENKAPDRDTLVSMLKAQKERALQALSARWDKIIADVQELGLDSHMEVNVRGALPQSDGVEAVSIQAGEFHNLSYTKAAKAILEKTNRRPLTTQEILAYFERSGRKMPGKNPSATLYSSLKKSSDFELVARNTWGLADWYEKKRKAPQSMDERTNEIMRQGAISFVEAQKRARKELEKEAKEA